MASVYKFVGCGFVVLLCNGWGYAGASPLAKPAAAQDKAEQPAKLNAADRPIEPISPDKYQELVQQLGHQVLYLDVTLNGSKLPFPLPFELRGGALHAPAETLRTLGFRAEKGITQAANLRTLAGVQAQIDEQTQSLVLIISPDWLDLATYQKNADTFSRQSLSPPLSGALLNYDLLSHNVPSAYSQHTLLSELRLFGGWGVLRQHGLSHQSTGVGAGTVRHPYRRLSTVFERELASGTAFLRVGDIVAASPAAWLDAPNLRGVQWVSANSIYTGQLRSPTQTLRGTAQLPSQVEFWLNGRKQYTSRVPAGPFELQGVSTSGQSGLGQLRIVDAAGQTTVVDVLVFPTASLLQAGTQEWALHLGQRQLGNSGYEPLRYQKEPTLQAALRRGLNDRLTLELGTQVEAQTTSLGVGLNASLSPNLRGQLAVQTALTTVGESDSVNLLETGVHRRTQSVQGALIGDWNPVSASLQAQYNSPTTFDAVPSRQIAAYLSWSLGRLGNVSATHQSAWKNGQWRTTQSLLGWSLRHNEVSVFLGLARDALQPSTRAQFTLEYRPGKLPISTRVNHAGNDTSMTLAYNQLNPADPTLRWQLQSSVSSTQPLRSQASVQKQHAYGTSSVTALTEQGNSSVFLSTNGALVLARTPGAWYTYATPKIDDAFAIVDTQVAQQAVLLDRRHVAVTQANGYALVTGLRAGETNLISLNPLTTAPSYHLAEWDKTVVPMRLGGTWVPFASRKIKAASAQVVTAQGIALSPGTAIFVNHNPNPTGWVGLDGKIQLDELSDTNHLRFDTNPPCTLTFNYPPDSQRIIPNLGELVCQ